MAVPVLQSAPRPKRRSPAGAPTSDLVLSAHVGPTDDLFPKILALYARPGASVLDTTYGRGVFWRNVPKDLYNLKISDAAWGVDARKLPWPSASFDLLVFDPPYMHGSGGTAHVGHQQFEVRYRNNARVVDGHDSVLALYLAAAKEAGRVLKRHGVWVVKCQDEVCANVQRLTHIEIVNHLSDVWVCEDLFVLVRQGRPGVSRQLRQIHSRKSHSYLLCMRKREVGRVWTGPKPAHT